LIKAVAINIACLLFLNLLEQRLAPLLIYVQNN
jgi:hypothetical protein